MWKKQARGSLPTDPNEWGDNYTFVALARSSRLVINYLTGPRDGTSTFVFVYDMKGRLVTTPGRVTFSSDGFAPYVPAMRAAFGLRVDYGQVVKQYGHKNRDDHRYEPARHADFIRKEAILGAPDFVRISTSLVERQNLTIRMHVRRLTRLVNGFGKETPGHGAALAMHPPGTLRPHPRGARHHTSDGRGDHRPPLGHRGAGRRRAGGAAEAAAAGRAVALRVRVEAGGAARDVRGSSPVFC